MRLAWFAATPLDAAGPADDTALLVRSLRSTHAVEVIDASRAHEFVWRHARDPFDLCVFELGGTAAHAFIAPYAVHYSGLVLLRGVPRHDRALEAARLVVVPHEPVARAIADDHPHARVRTLVPGVEPLPGDTPPVVTALRWPPDGAALTHAIAGFAARRAVIVFDTPETADWPSLDPQTWQPRHRTGDPICVSIDPRDEAHSLRLAIRRLERDAPLRERLGGAAHAWWHQQATVDRATAGFERLLEEARQLTGSATIGAEDGRSLARRILDDFGLTPEGVGL